MSSKKIAPFRVILTKIDIVDVYEEHVASKDKYMILLAGCFYFGRKGFSRSKFVFTIELALRSRGSLVQVEHIEDSIHIHKAIFAA